MFLTACIRPCLPGCAYALLVSGTCAQVPRLERVPVYITPWGIDMSV